MPGKTPIYTVIQVCKVWIFIEAGKGWRKLNIEISSWTDGKNPSKYRWQEDRRKNFPTDGNLERKLEEAKRRAERGEVDVDRQDKRKTLRSVLQLQRKLGLAKAAGTDCMRVEGLDEGFQGDFP